MKEQINQTEELRYKKMIFSYVNTAITHTEGVAREYDVVKSKLCVLTMNTKNIHVYIFDDTVNIDVFIKVKYGYAVPDVVCKLQEAIIALIKENTPLKVKNININVSDVIFE